MYIIYALLFRDRKRIYIGTTSNLERRIIAHRNGKTISTKNRGDFDVKVIESCDNSQKAREREKYWKSGCGKEFLKNNLAG